MLSTNAVAELRAELELCLRRFADAHGCVVARLPAGGWRIVDENAQAVDVALSPVDLSRN